jgi:hypothetical protein
MVITIPSLVKDTRIVHIVHLHPSGDLPRRSCTGPVTSGVGGFLGPDERRKRPRDAPPVVFALHDLFTAGREQ